MHTQMRQNLNGSRHGRRRRAELVQMRRFVLTVCLLGLMVVTTAVASYYSRVEASSVGPALPSAGSTSTTVDPAASLVSRVYTAELRVDDPSSTAADPRAFFTLRYDATERTVSYKLEVAAPLPNPSVAAICQGGPGQAGGTVVTLYSGPTIAGNFSGVLAEGTITQSDLVGTLQGQRLTDLVLLIQSGSAYATIGTAGRPVDALRGQIE